jgi:hypothetical protein
LATASLIIATSEYFVGFESAYLTQAVALDPSILPQVPAPMFVKAAKIHMKHIVVEVVFLWTAIFAVKFSFLVFSWQLVQSASKKILVYYWVVVGVTIISWVLLSSEPFIVCHHLRLETCE